MPRTSAVTRSTPREYADVATVCAVFNLHPDTLRAACRDGLVPFYRMGRAYRFDLEELDALFRHDATRPLDGALAVTPPGRPRPAPAPAPPPGASPPTG